MFHLTVIFKKILPHSYLLFGHDALLPPSRPTLRPLTRLGTACAGRQCRTRAASRPANRRSWWPRQRIRAPSKKLWPGGHPPQPRIGPALMRAGVWHPLAHARCCLQRRQCWGGCRRARRPSRAAAAPRRRRCRRVDAGAALGPRLAPPGARPRPARHWPRHRSLSPRASPRATRAV